MDLKKEIPCSAEDSGPMLSMSKEQRATRIAFGPTSVEKVARVSVELARIQVLLARG
jgi:hypothetical protein